MSQHDFDITTADANTGPSVRSEINSALQALASNNAGLTEPSTPYANMWWPDTTAGLMKQRNSANTAWVVKGKLDTGATDPVEPTLQNSWYAVNTGDDLFYQRSSDGTVHIHGYIKKDTAPSSGEEVFTLPVGFRPSVNLYINCYTTTLVKIGTDGVVSWEATYTSSQKICISTSFVV